MAFIAATLVLATTASAHPQHHHRSVIVSGRVSTFGPPGEGAGTTASGVSSSLPGIALWAHRETLGRYFCVTLYGGRLHAVLRHTDVGPAPWTGRAIDITGAGVARLRGNGAFRTDATGHARLLPRHRGPAWRCGRRDPG